jgi:hypothetical protein
MASIGFICFLLFITFIITCPLFIIFRGLILWVLNFFKPNLVFKTQLSMAKRGYYRYDGLMGFAKKRGFPVARVLYPDGKRSCEMAIGDAVDYQEMFGGEVIQP